MQRAGNIALFEKAPQQFKFWKGRELLERQDRWDTGTFYATYISQHTWREGRSSKSCCDNKRYNTQK